MSCEFWEEICYYLVSSISLSLKVSIEQREQILLKTLSSTKDMIHTGRDAYGPGFGQKQLDQIQD